MYLDAILNNNQHHHYYSMKKFNNKMNTFVVFMNILTLIIQISNINLINCESFKDDNVSNYNYLHYNTNPLTISLLPSSSSSAAAIPKSETVETIQSLPIFELNTNNNDNNMKNHFHNNKPSKLRLYLLADLAKAAATAVTASTTNNKLSGTYILTASSLSSSSSSSSLSLPLSSCDSEVSLRITTKNCTCINFNCQRFNNNNNNSNKTSRKLRVLERTCEDHCCNSNGNGGKNNLQNLKTKIFGVKNHQKFSNLIKRRILKCGEISNKNNSNNTDINRKIQIPWIIHILNSEEKTQLQQFEQGQKQQCIGTILRQNAIATTSDCVKRYTKLLKFKLNGENEEKEDVIKEIFGNDDHQNTVLLILSKHLDEFNEQKYPCIPRNDQILLDNENKICYATSFNSTGIEVKLKNTKECNKKIELKLQHNDDSNYICAEIINFEQQKQRNTILPGSPLVCTVITISSQLTDSNNYHNFHQNNLNGFQIVGIFNSIIENNLIFDNIIDQLQNIK